MMIPTGLKTGLKLSIALYFFYQFRSGLCISVFIVIAQSLNIILLLKQCDNRIYKFTVPRSRSYLSLSGYHQRTLSLKINTTLECCFLVTEWKQQ